MTDRRLPDERTGELVRFVFVWRGKLMSDRHLFGTPLERVCEAAGLVDCYSFWTFTDIFEENYFPSVPFHGGFGLLNVHGIPKPIHAPSSQRNCVPV